MFKMTMMKTMVCVALLCAAGSTMLAQSTTQGAIGGTVFDVTNAVVGKATVTIHNDGTNSEEIVTADDSGYFKAPLVEPGTYTVSVAAPGFEGYRTTGVVVQVSQLTTLEPHLTTGATSEVVEVISSAPIVNFESPDFSSNLNKTTLENLPVNNRRWSSLAMTTPGVVSDGNGYGLVSVRGISPILNDVMIDGADDNQAYYAEERGRTREAYSTAGGAVREFAVNTGVYSAEYGRAAGAVINSVTTSGTNKLHGEVYFYDRESNWNAFNDFATLTSPTGVVTPVKPEDLRKIYGFTADGALIKDKLFWMYTFDQHHRIFPGIAVASSPSFYNQPDATLPSCATVAANGYVSGTGCTINSLDSQVALLGLRTTGLTGAAAYAAGVATYDAGTAALATDLGRVSRFGDQEINTPKLDWQINGKEHLSFLYHRLRWDSPGGVQTTGTDDYGTDTWGNDFVKLDYGVTKLTSLLSSSVSNELLYQYGRELNDESQQPYSTYTKNNLVGNLGNVPEVLLDNSVFANIGSPYYSYRKALPDERKWQIDDVLHYSKGNHNLTFGGDVLHNADLLNNLYESNGYITYSYIGNYLADLTNKTTADTCGTQTGSAPTSATTTGWTGTLPCYSSFVQGFGASPAFGIATLDYSAFAQDNWKVSPNLTLQLGGRYDYEFLPTPSATLTSASTGYTPFPGVTNHPSDKHNVGVRMGFAEDLFGTGKTVLRGGYGIFYGRLNNAMLLNVELNTGNPLGQYTTSFKPTTAGTIPMFPNLVGTGSAPVPGAYFLSPHLENPMVNEYDLVIQQQVGKGSVFSISYLGALGRHLTNFLDLNLDPTTVENVTVSFVPGSNGSYGPISPSGAAPAPLVVPTYTKYGNTAVFGSVATNFQNITEVVSNINSSYNALVAEIQNRSLRNLQFDVNYTWSHSLDFNQNAQTTDTANGWYDPYTNQQANYGNSAYNVPNRLVGYALYTLPKLTGTGWYTYLSNGWKVDTSFQMQNGLPYSAGTSGFSGAGIAADLNGAGGLAILPQIGLNTYKLPRKIVDDARLQKDFLIQEKYNLALLVNVFNVANHQNIDDNSGSPFTAYKLGGSGTAGTATFQSATWQVTTSSNNSGFLYTPREVEIGAKLSF